MSIASCDTVGSELKTAHQGSNMSNFSDSGANPGGGECCEGLGEQLADSSA